ncbi:MAG: AMP-binding protein [Pseudomonadota bacterium]
MRDAACDAPLSDCLERADIGRVILSIAIAERERLEGRSLAPGCWAGWNEDSLIDEAGIGFDSLARLVLVARVSRFFALHEIGSEDYLVLENRVGGWVDIVAETLRRGTSGISVQTSGSTGEPKDCAHSWRDLLAEAGEAGFLPGSGPVLSLVPPHHLYGFLWGILAPRLAGRASEDARTRGVPDGAGLAEGTIIACPAHWAVMLEGAGRFAPEITGVCSGGPSDDALWRGVRRAGLGAFVEIYGSTETAGVGRRRDGASGFALLPRLEWGADGCIRRRSDGAALQLQDHIRREGALFHVDGRRDAGVQVGGVNVFPETIRSVLRAEPGVRDAALRLDAELRPSRLKAFVAVADGTDRAALEDRLRARCAAKLTPPERPVRFRFGADLPRNALGKLTDWDCA